jgi:hypothetical protein
VREAKARKRQLKVVSAAPLAPATSQAKITLGLLFLIFIIGVVARFEHLDDVTARTPDERVYVTNASRIAEKGFSELPAMVREYNRDPILQKYPPPMRIGYLALLAETMRLTSIHDVRAGVWLSCGLSIISLGLIGWIGFRFLPRWAAIYAMLSMALSLPELTLARRCWQDSLVVTLGLVLVWSTCEIIRNYRRWIPYAVLVATGSFMVLVKEAGVFVYGACILFVLVTLVRKSAWRWVFLLLSVGLAGTAISVLCFTSAAGGWSVLLSSWRHTTATHQLNTYAHEYQDGPLFRFLQGFWIVTRINILLCVFGAALAVFRPLSLGSLNLSLFRLFSWLMGLQVAILLLVGGAQNFRYAAPVYGAMYLLGGLGAWGLVKLASQHVSGVGYQLLRGVILTAVIVSVLIGYQDFERNFVDRGIPDLAVKMVTD